MGCGLKHKGWGARNENGYLIEGKNVVIKSIDVESSKDEAILRGECIPVEKR